MEKKNNKSKNPLLDFIVGCLFISYGSYRVNKQLVNNESTFRLILSIGLIVYGVFLLFKYFKERKQNR